MRLSLFTPPADGPRSMAAVKMLRISVTDRCNFRCTYCMPEEGVAWLPKEEILSFEEIEKIVRTAIGEFGVSHFKLTGGEPTVRSGLVDLVGRLKRIRGVEDLSMTTNGMRLVDLSNPLRQAGLDRITISIDSLRAERFHAITRTGDLDTVFRGMQMASDAGFTSIKINCVAMRGINDEEVSDFAQLTLDHDVTVRFIEFMPLGHSTLEEAGPAGGCGAQDRGDVFISEAQMRAAIEREFGPLEPVERQSEAGVGPAVPWRIPGAKGRIGFISAMSKPFCETCNRLRLTATGILRSCLFEGGEVDLKPILRGNGQGIGEAMERCVRLKPTVHSCHGNEQMSRIGG